MEWQTKVIIEPLGERLTYNTRFLLTGSCFAGVLSEKLRALEFEVAPDAFGVLFNPASIAQSLERLECNRPFSEEELIETPHGMASLWHHSSFTQPDKSTFLAHANQLLEEASRFFMTTQVVVVTLGTSWIYSYGGKVVANCHQLPASDFERSFLSVAQTVSIWKDLIARHPDKKWIFTVSPIRHLADGAHGNQLSKSSLLLAVEQLQNIFGNVHYFPAYEILLDELRDYRFYATDRCHPSEEAQEYIWQCFLEYAFADRTQQLVARMEKLQKALNHRVRFPNTPESARFKEKNALQLLDLRAEIASERKFC